MCSKVDVEEEEEMKRIGALLSYNIIDNKSDAELDAITKSVSCSFSRRQYNKHQTNAENIRRYQHHPGHCREWPSLNRKIKEE